MGLPDLDRAVDPQGPGPRQHIASSNPDGGNQSSGYPQELKDLAGGSVQTPLTTDDQDLDPQVSSYQSHPRGKEPHVVSAMDHDPLPTTSMVLQGLIDLEVVLEPTGLGSLDLGQVQGAQTQTGDQGPQGSTWTQNSSSGGNPCDPGGGEGTGSPPCVQDCHFLDQIQGFIPRGDPRGGSRSGFQDLITAG